MKKKLTVWMYVDPFSTMCDEDRAAEMELEGGGVELEYRELEALVTKAFPGVAVSFKRDVLFTHLKNGNPDFYIFDIGGMCSTDYSGQQRSKIKLVPQCDRPVGESPKHGLRALEPYDSAIGWERH